RARTLLGGLPRLVGRPLRSGLACLEGRHAFLGDHAAHPPAAPRRERLHLRRGLLDQSGLGGGRIAGRRTDARRALRARAAVLAARQVQPGVLKPWPKREFRWRNTWFGASAISASSTSSPCRATTRGRSSTWSMRTARAAPAVR